MNKKIMFLIMFLSMFVLLSSFNVKAGVCNTSEILGEYQNQVVNLNGSCVYYINDSPQHYSIGLNGNVTFNGNGATFIISDYGLIGVTNDNNVIENLNVKYENVSENYINVEGNFIPIEATAHNTTIRNINASVPYMKINDAPWFKLINLMSFGGNPLITGDVIIDSIYLNLVNDGTYNSTDGGEHHIGVRLFGTDGCYDDVNTTNGEYRIVENIVIKNCYLNNSMFVDMNSYFDGNPYPFTDKELLIKNWLFENNTEIHDIWDNGSIHIGRETYLIPAENVTFKNNHFKNADFQSRGTPPTFFIPAHSYYYTFDNNIFEMNTQDCIDGTCGGDTTELHFVVDRDNNYASDSNASFGEVYFNDNTFLSNYDMLGHHPNAIYSEIPNASFYITNNHFSGTGCYYALKFNNMINGTYNIENNIFDNMDKGIFFNSYSEENDTNVYRPLETYANVDVSGNTLNLETNSGTNYLVAVNQYQPFYGANISIENNIFNTTDDYNKSIFGFFGFENINHKRAKISGNQFISNVPLTSYLAGDLDFYNNRLTNQIIHNNYFGSEGYTTSDWAPVGEIISLQNSEFYNNQFINTNILLDNTTYNNTFYSNTFNGGQIDNTGTNNDFCPYGYPSQSKWNTITGLSFITGAFLNGDDNCLCEPITIPTTTEVIMRMIGIVAIMSILGYLGYKATKGELSIYDSTLIVLSLILLSVLMLLL